MRHLFRFLCAAVGEPPGADPHAGWCGEGQLEAGPYSISFRRRSGCKTDRHKLECVKLYGKVHIMRTNIVIDDKLMKDTLRMTGLKTKREAVELGLRTLLRLRKQAEIRRFRGKLNWQGDLDSMRLDK